jgi:hypothetical protein
MKTVSEIIGGAQALLNIPFNLAECFEEYLSNEYKTFPRQVAAPARYKKAAALSLTPSIPTQLSDILAT